MGTYFIRSTQRSRGERGLVVLDAASGMEIVDTEGDATGSGGGGGGIGDSKGGVKPGTGGREGATKAGGAGAGAGALLVLASFDHALGGACPFVGVCGTESVREGRLSARGSVGKGRLAILKLEADCGVAGAELSIGNELGIGLCTSLALPLSRFSADEEAIEVANDPRR